MIDIQHLSFGYPRKRLLYKDLSLSLPKGRIYGLLGKNGAGKSTLLKNLIGLLFPTTGNIQVNGFVPQQRKPSFLETIYFIPEEVYVPSVSIQGYCNLFTPFYPHFNEQKFKRYLKEFEIEDTGKLTSLSFGQQKKFIIAFALACNTSLLLMDEPTNGLDIPSKTQFRKLLASVMDDDRIIFISTHQVRDLENLIDHVIVVDNGQLLLQASIPEVTEKLSFTTVTAIPTDVEIFYTEASLKGIALVQENKFGEASRVNLEHLFNAAIEKPVRIQRIFSA